MGRGPLPEQSLKVLRQILAVGGIFILLLFAVGYTGKVLTSGRLHNEEKRLQELVQQEARRQIELQKDVANIDSEAAIERVARDELNMVKAGEQPIMIEDPTRKEGEPLLTPTPTATPAHWQMWLSLLLH